MGQHSPQRPSPVALQHSSLTSPSAGPGIAWGGSKISLGKPSWISDAFFSMFPGGSSKKSRPHARHVGMKKMGKALHFVDPSRNVGHLGWHHGFHWFLDMDTMLQFKFVD